MSSKEIEQLLSGADIGDVMSTRDVDNEPWLYMDQDEENSHDNLDMAIFIFL